MNINDTTILAISENMLTVWEYEDVVLEHYRQHLIEPIKNLSSIDNDLDSTLSNVIIETIDTVDGLMKYRSMIKGVKVDLNIVGRKNLRISIDNIKPIRLRYGSFDLSKQMTKWLEDQTNGTIIRLRCNNRCPETTRPILFIKAEILQNSRQKRGIRKDEDCSNRKCCLKSRYFQFRNSGFEHIETPDGFLMNFCDGICDQTLVPATNDRNALVQAMKISNLRFNPFKNKWVCCVPIKFASINVVEQYNNGTERLIPLKNVKVEECGCVI